MLFRVFRFSKASFNARDIFFHIISKLCRHLGTETDRRLPWQFFNFTCKFQINAAILLHEKFLQFDWLRAVVFQLNLKYFRVKITKPLGVVV